ncbi:MAG TPA: hypothetical protein VF384_07025 [Planctomycetota bacterium]
MKLPNTLTLATSVLIATCAIARAQIGSSPILTSPIFGSTELSHFEPLGFDLADLETQGPPPQGAPSRSSPSRWRQGSAILSGYFGAAIFDLERSNSSGVTVTADDVEMPSLGGGGQWKMAGDKIDFGFEALLGFNWRSGSTAFVAGGSGAAVAIDVDAFVFDLYGGPFANLSLGDGARIYVSAGPMMQWAVYEETLDSDGSGFGFGYYARTGFEFNLGRNTLMGFGVRWSDTEIDLGGRLGDLDADGFLWMITFSNYY